MHQWRKRYCIVRVNRGHEYQIAFFRSMEDADLAMAGKKISTSRVYVLPAGTAVEMQSTVLPNDTSGEGDDENGDDTVGETQWFGLSLKLPTQEIFLAFTSENEQEKWFNAVQKVSSNAIAHVVAAISCKEGEGKKEKKEEESSTKSTFSSSSFSSTSYSSSSAPEKDTPVLDEICLGLALLRPRPKPLAILKVTRLCLKLRSHLSTAMRLNIEKVCRQRLQDGLGAHSLNIASKYEEEEEEEDEEEEDEQEKQEDEQTDLIDMEQSVYDWIFLLPLSTNTTSLSSSKEKEPTAASMPTTRPIIKENEEEQHTLFRTSILWKRSDFWKTWKRRVVVFRSGIGKHDEVSYWRKSKYDGNLEEAVRGDVLGPPDGTYIVKGYRALPVEQRPEKNRPSGEADVFPFEIAIIDAGVDSEKKKEVSTMRLATDTISQRAEWAVAIQQATIFRRTNSIVAIPSKHILDDDDDENSSEDEDLQDVDIVREDLSGSKEKKNTLLPEMYDIARFYLRMFVSLRNRTLCLSQPEEDKEEEMKKTENDDAESFTLFLNFLDSLGGPDSASGKEFLRAFANVNLRPYKILHHIEEASNNLEASKQSLESLHIRFQWYDNLQARFDKKFETQWCIPTIWCHALLEALCKAFCLATRTYLFNLLEDDSDLAIVIRALKSTTMFEQKLVRELHRRRVLASDFLRGKTAEEENDEDTEKTEDEDSLIESRSMNGVLMKQSRWLQQWRRRSFVLRGRRLTVYHDCEKEIRDLLESEPDDVFALRPGTVSVVADDTTQCVVGNSQWFVMRLKISRAEIILAASTERDRTKWIKSFRKISARRKQLRGERASSRSSSKKLRKKTSSTALSTTLLRSTTSSSVHDGKEKEEQKRTSSSHFDPQNLISSVFEPHILRFVRVEEEALHKILKSISTSSCPETYVELNVHKTILASALDLTGNGFKRVLSHCCAVASGRVFWRLHRCFKDCLTTYSNYLLFKKLISTESTGGGDSSHFSTPRIASTSSRLSMMTPPLSAPLDKPTRAMTCCVANTAAYLIMIIPGLEDAFREHMEDAYADHVDMSSEMEHLYGIVNHGVRRLKDDVVRRLRPVMSRFRESVNPKKARRSLFSGKENDDDVEASLNVKNVENVLFSMCPTIQDDLSPSNYKRFCELLMVTVIRDYVRVVLRMGLATTTKTNVALVDRNTVLHMKKDFKDLICVLKRIPESNSVDLSSSSNKTSSGSNAERRKFERAYASFYSVLEMTRKNVMRIFAVLDVDVSLENFRDAVASVWKEAMPSALPGSVTPSLLPADELQSVLRLKGAREEESKVIMAELGLQYKVATSMTTTTTPSGRFSYAFS